LGPFRSVLDGRTAGGSRACLLDSVVADAKIFVVLVLQTGDAVASVQLLTDHLVFLAEVVEFLRQIFVLAFEDL